MARRKLPGAVTADEVPAQIEASELEAQLRARFLNPSYRPPVLPRVAVQLLETSRRSDVSLDEVVELLQKDAMLVGRVLRIASSPLYLPTPRRSEPSLRDAVLRLGLMNLRDVVTEVVLQMRVFQAKQYAREMSRLARHSSAAAHLARLLSRRCGVGQDLAFLVGLFHDVGLAGALITLGDQPPGMPVPRLADAWPAVEAVHPELSGVMLELWGLPESLRHAVAGHRGLVEAEEEDALAAMACVAEHLANRLGWSAQGTRNTATGGGGLDVVRPADLDHALRVLELPPDHLTSLENAGEVVLRQLAGTF